MRRLTVTMAAVALGGIAAAAASGQSAPPPAAAPAAAGTLPAGPGHDTLLRVCSACHAPEIAAQQRLSKEGWHELVQTMVANGAQGSDAEIAEIEAYLVKSFPDQPPAK